MNKNPLSPAFPASGDPENYKGMTLRDYFAAAALTSAYAWALTQDDEEHWQLTASEAYNMADAMLAERSK